MTTENWHPQAGTLAHLMCRLDMLLTGRTWTDAVDAARTQQRIVDDPLCFASGVDYYLSDEGRSLLCWYGPRTKNPTKGRLVISGDAPQRTLARWRTSEVKDLVVKIEDAIRTGECR